MKMLSAGFVEAARDVTNMDTFDCLYHDVSDAWARANNNMPVSLGPSSGSLSGYGVGAADFQLAQEMSASLKGGSCPP